MKSPPPVRRRGHNRHRPPPQIIGWALDIDGQGWAVRERNPTKHGFNVEKGWPEDNLPQPGNVPGGPRVILTEPLADYLRSVERPRDIDLPICVKVTRNLSRRAGVLPYCTLREQWWAERVDDLRVLSTEEFIARHGMSRSMADMIRKAKFGQGRKPTAWYRAPDAAAVILGKSQPEAADELGVSIQAISAARWRLRRA